MFDYCTRGLGYSAASAQRRIKAARAIVRVPEIYGCLKDGRLTLGVVEIISDALTGPIARDLIRDVCGKSREEARRVLAAYFPVEPRKIADRIEPIFLKSAESDASQQALFISDEKQYFRAEVQNEVGNSDAQFRVSFFMSGGLKEKLDRARELLYGACGPTDLEPLLDCVFEEYIQRHCPEARAKRRVAREERKARANSERLITSIDTVCAAAEEISAAMPENDRDPARSRYISDALRDEILKRDGYRCGYVADDGTKCSCRSGLQIDHVVPFAVGGRTEPSNLRTVCKTHNQMYARRMFGDEYIESIIARRKPGSDGRPTVYVRPSDVMDPAEKMVFG